MQTKAKPRILAVDDAPFNLKLLVEYLKHQYEIEICECPFKALELLRTTAFDLILLDIMMPVMDGFQAFQAIRQLPNGSQVPIIFLTATSDYEHEKTGLALGAADFIFKPIRVDLVRLRIGNILRLAQLSDELKASEERYRYVLDATGDGIWDWNIKDDHVVHNRAWCTILGLDDNALEHPLSLFSDLIHPEDFPSVQERLYRSLRGSEAYFSEHRLRHASGRYLWVEDRGQVAERSAEGLPVRMLGSVKDISDRKRDAQEIERLAFYDTLTELPNRRLFFDRLRHAILKVQRESKYGALLFIDIDHFKELNDTHGHAMGDALLIQIASRLQGLLRRNDTVARLGGDEFVIILEGLLGPQPNALEHAAMVGNKVLEALSAPYDLGIPYQSTPSVGLTLFDASCQVADEILSRADHAMYLAKREGRNALRIKL